MAYVITRPGGSYYGVSGWKADRRVAMQFPSKQIALSYVAENRITGALAEQVPPQADPGVATDYSPFGFGNRARG